MAVALKIHDGWYAIKQRNHTNDVIHFYTETDFEMLIVYNELCSYFDS